MKQATTQPTLKRQYFSEIRPKLLVELGLTNLHQVPKLEKIILNAGLGRSKDDKKVLETATNTLAKISGQTPQVTKARMSIANFKLRTGQVIGCRVTLRDQRMYEFLERLIHLVMPRFRDFRGASLKSFDRQGNYSIGFRDQSVFSELSFEETNPPHGLQATLVFENSCRVEDNRALLAAFGFPFSKQKTGEVADG